MSIIISIGPSMNAHIGRDPHEDRWRNGGNFGSETGLRALSRIA